MDQTYQLSPKQLESIALSDGRVNLWDGSIRSGKTYAELIRWLTIMADPPKGGEFVIFGKNTDAIYRNIFAPIWNEPSLAWAAPYCHYRQGDVKARMFKRRINVIGANDDRAESRIRGMTIAAALGDEITVLPENFFKQMLGRMSPPGAIMLCTTNPDSPNHWLKTDYINKLESLPRWRYFHLTIDDNTALTEEYKDSIKAEYSGLWYRRFILGEWVSADGAIYDMWDPEKHVIKFEDMPDMVNLFSVGIDYGTTNATAALTLGLGIDGRLYLTDEWRIDSTNRQQSWTDLQLSRGFLEWLAKPHTAHNEHLTPQYICVDPAAASFKVQLQLDGARGVTNADNDVAYGIRLMASMIGKGDLLVSDRCTGFLSEVAGYTWDPKATEKGEDKPVKLNDHSLDAARYALTTTETLWRPYLT